MYVETYIGRSLTHQQRKAPLRFLFPKAGLAATVIFGYAFPKQAMEMEVLQADVRQLARALGPAIEISCCFPKGTVRLFLLET